MAQSVPRGSSAGPSGPDVFGPLLAEVSVPLVFVAVCALLAAGFFAGAAAFAVSSVSERSVYATLCGVGGLLAGFVAVRSLRARLRVYELGITRQDLLGPKSMRYDQVETIRLAGPRDPVLREPLSSVELVGHGRRLRADFPAYEKTARAVRLALDRIVPRLGRQALERMRNGDILSFGRLEVAWPGLIHRGRAIRWHEIERAHFGKESLRLFPRDRPDDTVILPLTTPNLHVLIWLCQEMPAVLADEEPTSQRSTAAAHPTDREPVWGFPAEDPELGALLCGSPRRIGLVFSCLLLAGVILVVAFVVWAHTGPGQVDRLGVAYLGFFLGVAVAAVAWFDFRRLGFGVYERGVRDTRCRIHWEECEHVTYAARDVYYHGMRLVRSLSLTLEGGGVTIRLRGRRGARTESLFGSILKRVLPGLVARRLEELRAGESYRVGNVTLTAKQLVAKRVAVPLIEVSSAETRGHLFHIWRSDQEEAVVSVDANRRDIPVLHALLQELMASARGPSA